jgi:plasmid stabilization system protein ParE
MSVAWKVRLAERAELDFPGIVTWTLEHFGERQGHTFQRPGTLTAGARFSAKPALGAKPIGKLQVTVGPK